jgi:hypothetical protein
MINETKVAEQPLTIISKDAKNAIKLDKSTILPNRTNIPHFGFFFACKELPHLASSLF